MEDTYIPVLRQEQRLWRLPGQRRAAVGKEAKGNLRAHVERDDVGKLELGGVSDAWSGFG